MCESTGRIGPEIRVMLLVALVAAGMAGCKKENASMAMPQRPPASVTVAVAQLAPEVPVYLDAIGRMVPTETVSIVPQISGKLIAAYVEDGANVKKGDLLFEIDPRPFEAALQAAEATLSQAKADHEFAVGEYERLKGLANKAAVSQQEFHQRESAVAVADAKIAAADAAIATAKLNLEYTKIYSPITGRAGARLVDAGNVVKENDKPLIVLQQMTPILAEFTVTENDLGTVRKYLAERGLNMADPQRGLTVDVDVPGNSARVLSALGSAPVATMPSTRSTVRQGRLVFLDNTIQGNAGTVRLRADVPNDDGYFWPGQFVNVRLILAMRKNAVMVPAQAEQIGQQGAFVFVVQPDGTAQMRPIKSGQRQGEMLVIESGVEAGDQVVTTGQYMVMPGSKVNVVTGNAAGPATAPATVPAK